ncbi:glycosyltransferase family 4 protein [Marinobacter changyiensis]|uniref:glycosyltransferase family 4 protein n=1 Tax=Marinobacter changyiensis TaxID=2604091 RepID=UPI0012650891|nr:glycosyltransferase family 1 protein [Marinobacter changyiensis]
MAISVVHFMRDPRPNVFSIERLYEDVRNALPVDCEAVEWVCRNPSTGFWPRLRDAWSARKAQGDINHITGDTHYLTYFLDRRRTVLTVHDLVTIERFKGLKRLVLWFFWFWLPVMRSRMVITVSEATRQALLKSVRCSPDKVVVIHNPVSEEFQPAAKTFNTEIPRILQVGTKFNKNVSRVAEALAGIRCKLVIIGSLNSELGGVLARHEIDYENHVGLSREALLDQYVKADMLMFASTYEGFGLPVVEANAVGRPVITSNLSPMTEVADDAACLIDPYDPGDIRAGVARIVNDSTYRESLIAAGYQNALRFQSTAVAESYAAIYRKVAQ